ncbi:MAG: hypothetical protein NC307_10345 [Roseburia sp.]|nr:hypothetical protein [Roseburia sp.]
MSNTYQDLQNSHLCFGGYKNNAGRIHLPVSPGCNIAYRFCDRVINDVEERPGVTSKVITPEESLEILRKVSAAGFTIKKNTVLVPEINGGHIEEIAKTVKEAGASIWADCPQKAGRS